MDGWGWDGGDFNLTPVILLKRCEKLQCKSVLKVIFMIHGNNLIFKAGYISSGCSLRRSLYDTSGYAASLQRSSEASRLRLCICNVQYDVYILLNMQSLSREATVMQCRRGVAASI